VNSFTQGVCFEFAARQYYLAASSREPAAAVPVIDAPFERTAYGRKEGTEFAGRFCPNAFADIAQLDMLDIITGHSDASSIPVCPRSKRRALFPFRVDNYPDTMAVICATPHQSRRNTPILTPPTCRSSSR
jgi:hypothetical protein